MGKNKPRKVSRKTEARRRKLLIESSAKFGYITGAQEMQKKAAEAMDAYFASQAEARYVGDILAWIGAAVWLDATVFDMSAGKGCQ